VVYTVAIERETRHLVIGEGALVTLAAALRMHIVDKEVCVCVCVCVCVRCVCVMCVCCVCGVCVWCVCVCVCVCVSECTLP